MYNIIPEIAPCKTFKVTRQIKDENVTNLQNLMLASISYHIILIDLVITTLVWKWHLYRTNIVWSKSQKVKGHKEDNL